jgi:hypothetical protein
MRDHTKMDGLDSDLDWSDRCNKKALLNAHKFQKKVRKGLGRSELPDQFSSEILPATWTFPVRASHKLQCLEA